MKIKKSTKKKIKKTVKRVKRTVNRYATKIRLRRRNPHFTKGLYYSVLMKDGAVWKGVVDETNVKDSTGAKFVILLDRFRDEIYLQYDNIRDYKPITEFEYIRTFYDRPKKY